VGNPVYGIFFPGGIEVDGGVLGVEEGAVGVEDGVKVGAAGVSTVVVGGGDSILEGGHGGGVGDAVVVDVGEVVVVDEAGSQAILGVFTCEGSSVVDVVVGCAMPAATGVVTRNSAVTDTASALAMFFLRAVCFAAFKAISPLVCKLTQQVLRQDSVEKSTAAPIRGDLCKG